MGGAIPQENEDRRVGPSPGWNPRGIAPLREPVWDARIIRPGGRLVNEFRPDFGSAHLSD